jgi:glucose-6-phosphate 1-dehydrogenase
MEKLVIFGASGNLAVKKIYPALFSLFQRGLKYSCVGYGRTPFSVEEYQSFVSSAVKAPKYKKQSFIKQFSYCSGGYNQDGIRALADFLKKSPATFYLAIPISFNLLNDILKALEANGLIKKETKIVLEKPFGTNYFSARKINRLLLRYLKEDQIFRIDHYLAKDFVKNLFALRFANTIFEPIWNRKYIESFQIEISETEGIGNRGEYYDRAGAIRDVIQNHLLQLLALVTMPRPVDLSSASIHLQKDKILEKIRLFEGKGIENIVLGQYKGYRKERFVKEDSLTETFASIRVEINSPRWKGVPIYLVAGKKREKQATEIIVNFRNVKDNPWSKNCAESTFNQLIIKIQPESCICLRLNSILDSNSRCPSPVDLKFNFLEKGNVFREAYENALEDLFSSERSLFLGSKEILLSWKFIDRVLDKIANHRRELLGFY